MLRALDRRGLLTDELRQRLPDRGSVQEIAEIPEELRAVFATANEISPRDHIRMQAVFQRHCDNAVSKTVNLPHQAGPEIVRNCFLEAWRSGLKGITVFRDGCKSEQVYYHGNGG